MMTKDPKLGHSTWLAVAAFVVLSMPSRAEGSYTYAVIDLTLGGSNSQANGINDKGQVVGVSTRADGQERAFLYSNGLMTDLGTLGGNRSDAHAINNAEQVVGILPGSNGRAHSFLYSNGVMTDLGSLDGGVTGFPFTNALGINDKGQVVGVSRALLPNNKIEDRAFLYSDGVMTNLGTLGGTLSVASGINDAGQIVGYSNRADGQQHAFLYSNGVMTDLGTLGGGNSAAAAINNAGQIVGNSYLANFRMHAILYSDGVMTDLGTLGGTESFALGINDAGQVVGSSNLAGGGYHAFLYRDNVMVDLNSLIDPASGWTLVSANGINNTRQIVGWGYNAQGQRRGFLLVPLAPVPEPSSIILSGIGLVVLTGLAVRRRLRSSAI